jgi:site-specific recombinase XerD
MSLRTDLDAYIAYRAATDWSPATVASATSSLRLFLRWLEERGHAIWPTVQPADLDAYRADLRRRMTPRTQTKQVWLVRGLFGWLADAGLVLVDPARDLDPGEGIEEALPPVPLSVEQVQHLFDLVPARDVIDLRTRLHLELLYSCALRLAESINLDVRDLDLDGRRLIVRCGKGGRDREAPLMRGTLLAADAYLAVRRELLRGPDHGALLLGRDGRRLHRKVIGRTLDRLSPQVGAHLHPHLLRHSLAVHLLRGKVDVRVIQDVLGHMDLDTTKIYLRLVPGHLKDDYEKAMPPIVVEVPPRASGLG